MVTIGDVPLSIHVLKEAVHLFASSSVYWNSGWMIMLMICWTKSTLWSAE